MNIFKELRKLVEWNDRLWPSQMDKFAIGYIKEWDEISRDIYLRFRNHTLLDDLVGHELTEENVYQFLELQWLRQSLHGANSINKELRRELDIYKTRKKYFTVTYNWDKPFTVTRQQIEEAEKQPSIFDKVYKNMMEQAMMSMPLPDLSTWNPPDEVVKKPVEEPEYIYVPGHFGIAIPQRKINFFPVIPKPVENKLFNIK